MTQVAVPLDVSALYAAHRLPLVRMAILLVDDQASAEDVVQDAFIGLYRSQARIRDPQAALGYLRVSVINGARSMLRRRGTARKYLRAAEPENTAAADADLLLADEHSEVLAAVRKLPPRQQEVLVHHRQHWRGAVQRLNLAFLVDAEDQRSLRRVQIEPDHVADLLDELRIAWHLEGVVQPHRHRMRHLTERSN